MQAIRERFLGLADGDAAEAAKLLAEGLMKGDAAAFKAGYTHENAVLAAAEVFPEVGAAIIADRTPGAESICIRCDAAITRAADGAWEDESGACGCGDAEHEPEG